MKKLYETHGVIFAVILIVIYVVGMSTMQRVSESLGVEYLAETVFVAVLSAVLLLFLVRNGLLRQLGLCRPEVPAARALFYLPLVLIAAGNAVFGVGTALSARSLVLHTLTMLGVGFLEELIFRGFLLRGIARENLTRAAVISAVTFGLGHIVNLLNGYAVFDSITQIVYAVTVGFLLVILFLRTGSLLPCMAFHALNNCLTVVISGEHRIAAVGSEQTAELISLGVRLVLCIGYLIWLLRMLPRRELADL